MRIVYAAVVYLCVLCVPVGTVCAAAPAETGAAGGIPAAAANAADAFPGLTESGHAAGRSEAHVQTAESIFRGLPASIFGNTVEPITEEAKQKLLEFGYIANWVILESRPLFMRISAVSDYEGEVSVQLFPAAEGGVAVLAARTAESCAAELWRYDRRGRSVPEPEPEGPLVSDYFLPGRKLPPATAPSTGLCLEGADLEAKPLFWGPAGLMEVQPDNRVIYAWDGERFIKRVVPAGDASAGAERP